VDVKYIEVGSKFISSLNGIKPGPVIEAFCPFFNIVIGLPSFPLLDQLFVISPPVLAVDPNLILFPNLPSNILSPANGITAFTSPF
jgi:hypothetical protein